LPFLLSLRTVLFPILLIIRLLTVTHIALGSKFRTWFFSTLIVLGGIGIFNFISVLKAGETIGYIGRVGSAYDVTLNNYFIMQICCLIISPAFFSAALYLTIGNLYIHVKNLLIVALLLWERQTRS